MKFNKKSFDIKKFTGDEFSNEAYYGLDPNVKFCSKCLMPNQRSENLG